MDQISGASQTTRAGLLRRAALGGAVVGGLVLPQAVLADTRSRAQDREIMNFLLIVSRMEAAFYTEALAKNVLSGEPKVFAGNLAKHHTDHVDFLVSQLGSAAKPSPKFDFKGTTASQGSFLATAPSLEGAAVSAYNGQVFRVKAVPLLSKIGSILACEARHSAWSRTFIGRQPAEPEESFNGKATADQVLTVLRDRLGFFAA